MELDKIDKNILNLLRVDTNITNIALAQKINLSPAATLERVKKLEQHEIITNYHAHIDYFKLGFLVRVVATVRLQRMTPEHIKLFKLTINRIAEITTCYQVIGDFDFILMVQSRDLSSYQNMITEKLYTLEIVDEVKTLSITQLLKNKQMFLE